MRFFWHLFPEETDKNIISLKLFFTVMTICVGRYLILQFFRLGFLCGKSYSENNPKTIFTQNNLSKKARKLKIKVAKNKKWITVKTLCL